MRKANAANRRAAAFMPIIAAEPVEAVADALAELLAELPEEEDFAPLDDVADPELLLLLCALVLLDEADPELLAVWFV